MNLSSPGHRGDDPPGVSVRAVVTTRVGHLALAMLAVELLAGMQTYLNQTILPLVAADLGARQHYGLVTAAAMVPTFLTMPLGGSMLVRWRADTLMTALTGVLVAGAVMGAVAPGIGVYVAGEVLRGLASGALATVSMGVLVAGMPEAWRRLFLAAGSAMWIVSSLAGPAYAAGVSATWGWRWALVAYVPVLVVARLVMARQVRGLKVTGDDAAAPWLPALALAGGIAVLGGVPASSSLYWVSAACGMVTVVWACLRILPDGVVRLAPGRPAAIATLAWLCATYFALDTLISPAAHDVLGLGPAAVGLALTLAGVAWSVVAMYCGARPARQRRVFLVRTSCGGVLLSSGALGVAAALGGALPWWWLHVGFSASGLGMGMTHQDTVIRCVTAPQELGGRADQISQAAAATSVAVAGGAGGAALGSLLAAVVAPTPAGVQGGLVVPVVVALAAGLALTPLLARRAAA